MGRNKNSLVRASLVALALLTNITTVRGETSQIPDFFEGLSTLAQGLASPRDNCRPKKNPLATSWEELFSELRIVDPVEQNLFRKHLTQDALNDHMTCRPSPQFLNHPCSGQGQKLIQGHQVYLAGGFETPYRYRIGCFSGVRHISLRIHWRWPESGANDFRVAWDYCRLDETKGSIVAGECRIPLTDAAKNHYANWVFSLASEYWNRDSEHAVYHLSYEPNPERADFNLPLIEGNSRGPYFFQAGSIWSPQVVAHEVGHMLGLNDEYGEISGCHFKPSLMCDVYSGRIRRMHHYLVQRKAYCGSLAQRPLRRKFTFR